MNPRATLSALSLACLSAMSGLARAELTASERGQIRSYIDAADLSTATRFRSLLGRPDLTGHDAVDVLATSVKSIPITAVRERYLREVLFGPASLASRAALVGPVCQGLLARADVVLREAPGSVPQWLQTEPSALEELMRIHQFIEQAISPASGVGGTVRNESLQVIAQAYRVHVSAHAGLLGHRNPAEGEALLLRARVALNVALLSAILMNREETAEWLGLGAVSRNFFLRTGVVLESAGAGPDIRLAEVARLFESVPTALQGTSLILVDKAASTKLRSPAMLSVRTALGSLAPVRDHWWPIGQRDDAPEQAFVESAWAISIRAVRQQASSNGPFAGRLSGMLQRASSKGETACLAAWLTRMSMDRDAASSLGGLTAEMLVAGAATMLLIDARRAVDSAMVRYLADRPEPLEQLLEGLVVLAAGKQPSKDSSVLVDVGMLGGKASSKMRALMRDGEAVGFQIDGHSYEVDRTPQGAVTGLRHDGRAPDSSTLASASLPVLAGDRWSAGRLEFVRLGGSPRLALVDEHRFIAVSSGESSTMDGVFTQAPSIDHEVAAELWPDGAGGGLVVRASTGIQGFEGVGLLLACEATCAAHLVQFSADGQQQPLAQPMAVEQQPSNGYKVRLRIEGEKIRASVGATEVQGKLAQPLKPGHVGLVVRPQGRIEVRDWRVDRVGPTKRPGHTR